MRITAGAPDAAADARARAAVYRLLAIAFDFPTPELHESLANGTFAGVLRAFEERLGTGSAPLSRFRGSHQDLESGYISIFEIGGAEAGPVSLRESTHPGTGRIAGEPRASGDPRRSVMEDLLRFYHHFGLRLTPDATHRSLPDHLCCELEMLAFLCAREAELVTLGAGSEEAASCRRAQRDLLHRHLERWLGRLGVALDGRSEADGASAFYAAAARAMRAAVAAHARALAGEPGSVAAANVGSAGRTGRQTGGEPGSRAASRRESERAR